MDKEEKIKISKVKKALAQKSLTQRKRIFIQSFKKSPCLDCDVIYPPHVMDFDHRDGSDKKLLISRVGAYGFQRLENEISKCDVVCSNCHRTRTHNRKLASLA